MSLFSTFAAIIGADSAPAPSKPRPNVIPLRKINEVLVGRGFVDPRQRQGTRRIAVTLDEETFRRVRDYAAKQQISFAAAARQLIERGVGQPGE